MSTVAAAKPSEKGVKRMFKRLTTKLKRKGDKHKDEEETEHNGVGPHEEVEVNVEGRGHGDDAKTHMKNMLGTEDIDDEEVGKSKTYTEDTESKSKVKKKKVDHLLRRSKKYELTKSASKGHLEEAVDEGDHSNSNANKAKEEDSDANIQAVEEHHKEKGSMIKKTKEEKKREKKERKERKKSLRKSAKQPNEQTAAAVGQNDPVNQVVTTAQPAPALAVVPATGRPSNGGLIRPLSCPPQPFNGELSTYGLRAIADAIQDVASAIAPELQPKTPQMTLAAFVEGELQHAQLQQIKKPNLPSFDLPPPPSPPRNARMIPVGTDSRSTDSIDKSGGRRVRSMASLSQEELATLASSRAPFQSPLPELPKLASVSSPFATTASELPQFTAQPSAASDTNERVKVSSKGRSGSKHNKKRTSTGPVPTFTLFASSEPVKVPLLPIVLPSSNTSSSAVVAHKRKGAEHDAELPAEGSAVIDGAPDAKCARLDEQPPQEDNHEKADTEAEFEAIPEVCEPVEGGRRIFIEEQKSKRRPSIHPDEIKILQEEQQRLQSHNDEASNGEVTIYITDGSPSSSTEPSPDVEHNPHQAASESGHVVDERPSVPDAQRAEEPVTVVPVESDAQQNEALNELEGEDETQEEEEESSLGSQQSRAAAAPQTNPAQQQQRQNGNNRGGRRNRRGKGKNRTLRKQGTKTRLTYR